MKNKKVSLGKLSLKKMTISSLESSAIQGGKAAIAASGNVCDSCDNYCNSQNTKFTEISNCCSNYPPK